MRRAAVGENEEKLAFFISRAQTSCGFISFYKTSDDGTGLRDEEMEQALTHLLLRSPRSVKVDEKWLAFN